jgi:hypothetical protein
MFFMQSTASRPDSPTNAVMYQSQSDSAVALVQQQLPSPTYDSSTANPENPSYSPVLDLPQPRYNSQTPSPVNTSYSDFNLYPTHSPSTSTSNSNPRSTSPALSVASALTSVSSNSPTNQQIFNPFPLPEVGTITPIAPRAKQRKQRLFNVDRKAICVYHRQHPNARQEDIARRYGVERSTISKILKFKTKWLNVPEHEDLRVAKHR